MNNTFSRREQDERNQLHANLRVLDDRVARIKQDLSDLHKLYRETKSAARGIREHLQDQEVRRMAPHLYAAMNEGPRAYLKRVCLDPFGYFCMKHDGLCRRMVDMARDGAVNAGRVIKALFDLSPTFIGASNYEFSGSKILKNYIYLK